MRQFSARRSLLYLAALIGTSLLLSAFSLWGWKGSLDNYVRLEAEKSFSALFKRPVTIGQAGGPIVGKIVLNDLTIPGIGRIKEVILNYNPLEYAYQRGDIIPALSKITASGAELRLERDAQGKLSIADLLVPTENGKSAAPPFSGIILFQDCRLAYQDKAGFRPGTKVFQATASSLEGKVDLRRQKNISFFLSGRTPEDVKVQGNLNAVTGQYTVKINTQKLDLSRWGNYLIPLAAISVESGQVDAQVQLSPPKSPGWPLRLEALFAFHNARGVFFGYPAAKLTGQLKMIDENISFQSLRAEVAGCPLELSGQCTNFQDLTLALAVKTEQAEFYGQKFVGAADVFYRNGRLTITAPAVGIYKGKVSVLASLEVLSDSPRLELQARFRKLDLGTAAQNYPGIEGQANGSLILNGPITNLTGQIEAKLEQATTLGQPLDQLSIEFAFAHQAFILKNLRAVSGNDFFQATGQIDPQLNVSLSVEAAGLRLTGKSPLGPLGTKVENFQGEMSWQINESFFAAPLRQLAATGQARLSEGKIGEQSFSSAEGKIAVGNGKIIIDNAKIVQGTSTLLISGETGVGHPTALLISGEGLALADLKIFNHFLPAGFRDPKGKMELSVFVNGELPASTKFDSLLPLLDLTACGQVSWSNGSLGGVPLRHLGGNFWWTDRKLSIQEGIFFSPNSKLTFNFNTTRSGQLQGKLGGNLDLDELSPWLGQLGRIGGRVALNAELSGKLDKPQLLASLNVQSPRFNRLFFDELDGSIFYQDGLIHFYDPFLLREKDNRLKLAGKLDLKGPLDLELKAEEAELSFAYLTTQRLLDEIFSRLPDTTNSKDQTNLKPIIFPASRTFTFTDRFFLYSDTSPDKNFLSAWEKYRREPTTPFSLLPDEHLSGKLQGRLRLTGQLEDPALWAELKIKKGSWRSSLFDQLETTAFYRQGELQLQTFQLEKKQGKISASGSWRIPERQLALALEAKEAPLDILETLFPAKKFSGNFNAWATISGVATSPNFSLEARVKDFSFTGLAFDELILAAEKKDNRFSLPKFSLKEKSGSSTLSGSLVLSPGGSLALRGNLAGNSPGLLNLFTNDVAWLKGETTGEVTLSGTFDQPKLSGQLQVKEASLAIGALNANLEKVSVAAVSKDNSITITSLTGYLHGPGTKGISNPLSASGQIELSQLFSAGGKIPLSATLAPTSLVLKLPNLFDGSIELKKASLQGEFDLASRQGLRLSAETKIHDSVITLAAPGSGSGQKLFPLQLDLLVDLEKNTYVTMGEVSTINLSNILMNLEVNSQQLKIGGNLTEPMINGKVGIRRGNLTIFNREFLVVAPEQQARFFPYDAEKIRENSALFSADDRDALPRLTLTAQISVDEIERDSEGNPVKKKVIILSRLQGKLAPDNKEEPLKISLYGFTEDKSKTPSELVPVNYDEQALRVLLLPDFIRAFSGIGRSEHSGEAATVDTNALIADYLNSRVQTLLFRGIEREAEQRLGLESLTLEYNFGPSFRKVLGTESNRGFDEDRPAWSVGFVKGLFDRLYLDFRYQQGMERSDNPKTASFNYQLIYKISSIWSIMYYREPLSISDPATGYQKLTLKAGFAFW